MKSPPFQPARFTIGDLVCWTHVVSDPSTIRLTGIIQAVTESDSGFEGFNMYDVKFAYGSVTLYGTQIEPA